MKIAFLGTNGWYDTVTGNTICVLIETDKEYIVLDAGNGLYKLSNYINTVKPIYIFLSHFHLDHIIGFHTLCIKNHSQGIRIYGPEGASDILSRVVNPPYTISFEDLPTRISIIELKRFNTRPNAPIPINVEYRELMHQTICYGYRFKLDGKVITFCTDTGLCENLYALSKDADLLIAECSLKTGEIDKDWPHLNPEDAANTARKSNVRQLALIHFDASRYKCMSDRKSAEKVAQQIFKNTFAAADDMQLEL